ncbi:hypothetical protein OY671_008819, partial [Metschnikowia pulcherrima]
GNDVECHQPRKSVGPHHRRVLETVPYSRPGELPSSSLERLQGQVDGAIADRVRRDPPAASVSVDDALAQHLRVVAQHPELKGSHDSRTRTSGDRDFVQFHVWVAGKMTVTEAHRVMDEIEEKSMEAFPGVEVSIHPDPEGSVNEAPSGARDLLAPGPDGESPASAVQGAPAGEPAT